MPICPKCTKSYPVKVQSCPECKLELITDQTMLVEQKLYKIAHALHYEKNQFQAALNLYRWLIELYPNSPEAGYAKNQIKDIEAVPADQRPQPIQRASEVAAAAEPAGPDRLNLPSAIPVQAPLLTVAFNIVGIFLFVGGLIYAKMLWPPLDALANAVAPQTAAYIPSVVCLIAGVIAAIAFFALAKIIADLDFIKQRIEQLKK